MTTAGRPARRLSARIGALHARTPLRVRLAAAVLLLVAVAIAGSGFAAITFMRANLVGRVDSQLRGVAQGSATEIVNGELSAGTTGGGGGGRDGGRDRRSLPSAYVVEVLDASGATVTGPSHELIDEHEPLPDLPRVTAAESRAAGTALRTVAAVSGGESWRVLVEPVTLTSGGQGTALVAQSLGDVDGTVNELAVLVAVIGAVAVVVVAGVGYFVVRASLRPLREVERTAAAIAGGDLGRRVTPGDRRTEVGSLALSLNTMLGGIEEAFAARAASERAARESEDRMRQFVSDAGHELRTPLTTIRGFAELYRQGAAGNSADVHRFMDRIEGESTRMGVLVDDLLLLARLDQHRPLRTDPVDVLALVTDAVHDIRAVAPDRRVELTLGPTDPPPVVTGDELRLRQVLANLLANAVQHTPSGTPVAVGLGTLRAGIDSGSALILTVADTGPGMSAEHAARAFVRFFRADAARSRVDGGSGLGLSIVQALVTGHGGAVHLETAPGAGLTVTVTLPLAEAGPAPELGSSREQ